MANSTKLVNRGHVFSLSLPRESHLLGYEGENLQLLLLSGNPGTGSLYTHVRFDFLTTVGSVDHQHRWHHKKYNFVVQKYSVFHQD